MKRYPKLLVLAALIASLVCAMFVPALALEDLAYAGEAVNFIKEDGSQFGMFTPQEGTTCVISGGRVVIHYVPKNTTVYNAIHFGAIDDDELTADVGFNEDGTFDISLGLDFCGKAVPVAPIKASDGGTTASQYYLAIPAEDKLEDVTPVGPLAYEGDVITFIKADGSGFGMFAPQEGTTCVISGGRVVIHYEPKNRTTYNAIHWGAIDDEELTWDIGFNEDGSFDISLGLDLCGKAMPVAPLKADGTGTTSTQYYLAIPAEDKLEDVTPVEPFVYEGDAVNFIKDDGSQFGMFTPQEGTTCVINGDNVEIHYVPKNTTVYCAIHWGAIDDEELTRDVVFNEDGTFDITLDKSNCGMAIPVAPIKASDGGTTASQYYLAIPAENKLEDVTPIGPLAYEGDVITFIKADGSGFGMFAPQEGTTCVVKDGRVVIHYEPKNRTTYNAIHWGAIDDEELTWDIGFNEDGSFDISLGLDLCGKAMPVAPLKADGTGTTSTQYYLAIPAEDKLEIAASIEIITQPEDLTVAEGETADFTVEAEGGEGELSFQWYVKKTAEGDWSKISAASAKTAHYSLTAAARHNGYQYQCLITDGIDVLWSDVVTLTVEEPAALEIVDEPMDVDVAVGEEAVFSVFVEGDGQISYQWYVKKTANGDFAAVKSDAAKLADYRFTALARHNGYQYKCYVTDGRTELWSAVVTLTVTEPAALEILEQPEDAVVEEGERAAFWVLAEGEGELSYQWYVKKTANGDFTAVKSDAAKQANYSFTAQLRHNGYRYKCLITDGETELWTEEVLLTVEAPAAELEIVDEPMDVDVAVGEEAVFSVFVEGDGQISYQWYVKKTANGDFAAVKSDAAKLADYRFTALARHNGYQYKCFVTDGRTELWSAVVTLTVTEPAALEILEQPEDAVVEEGERAEFWVLAEGEGELSYQWYVKKTANGDWSKISAASARTANYSLTAAARHNGYRYKCLITDGSTKLWTEEVLLTVGEPAVLEIVDEPMDVDVEVGEEAVFSVFVEGEGQISYQWYVKKTADGDFAAVKSDAAKLADYRFTALARHNGYQYKCYVTDGRTELWSAVVTLTVG